MVKQKDQMGLILTDDKNIARNAVDDLISQHVLFKKPTHRIGSHIDHNVNIFTKVYLDVEHHGQILWRQLSTRQQSPR